MSQLAERFAAALEALVADGSVKERLARAYAEHLETLDAADLPPGLRAAYADLTEALNRVEPAGNESRARASIRKMSPAEAAGHAGTIVKLYAAIVQQGERAEPLKVVSAGKPLPRHLAQRP